MKERNANFIESLEEDYIVEQDFHASDTDHEEDEKRQSLEISTKQQIESESLSAEVKPSAITKNNCNDLDSVEVPVVESQSGPSAEKKKKKSKGFTHLSFSDYGMDHINADFDLSRGEAHAEEQRKKIQPKWCQILDSIYDKDEKQFYIKSHTKVKVLIVCSSALRCVDVIRSLKNGLHKNVQVAKLFARHMKVHEQIKVLKEGKFLVGVGTPARIVKIMQDDPDAIPLKKLDYMLIDSTYRDAKNMSILDLPDTGLDTKKLFEICRDANDAFKFFSI